MPGPSDAESQFSERGYHAIRGRALGREFVVRGLKRDRSLRIVTAGHAFVQNLRRGHYELAVDPPRKTQSPPLSPN